jgi:Zn-dependent alcohol dehydrogenase
VLSFNKEEGDITQPGQPQIAIKATGLCGSDRKSRDLILVKAIALTAHHYTRDGEFVHREPAVLGHEAAGIVVSLRHRY